MENSQVNLPYIPDDLLLNCLARVSRVYYPTLSLVSKRFRSLVSSHEIYRIRKFIGRTENCLYLYLRLSSEYYLRWFTLCRGPTQIPNPNPNRKSRWFTSCFRPNKNLPNGTMKEENKSSDIRMVPVQTDHNLTPLSDFTCTSDGPNIYMIGPYMNAGYSRRELLFMDCRSHTWHKTPPMEVAPKKPLMKVLDGKIYVMEGCKNPDFSNFIKVFDPKTQIWEHVPNPSAEIRGSYVSKSFVFDEKLYLYGDKTLAYKPKENKWDVANLSADDLYSLLSDYSCIIDNVVYSYVGLGMFLWHDSKERLWLPLNGLEEDHQSPEPPYRCMKLLSYGEKIAVFWEKKVRGKKMIWCAVISLERRSRYEMYGKYEWCDVVLTVPQSCSSLTMISVIV